MAETIDSFELSPPLDLSHHFSDVTNHREASQIKKFYKYFSIPGIAQLAGGLPNPGYFPFDTLESKTALPQRFKPTPNTPVDPPSIPSKHKHDAYLNDPTSSHVTVPHDSNQPNRPQRIDLDTALQYGTAQGYPPLYQFIREFALTRLHPNIPYKNGAEVILTCGNTDGFAKALDCFTNIWVPDSGMPLSKRGSLLCEEFAYTNALQAAKPRGMNIVPIAMDAEGMLAHGDPKCLYNVLANWDVERDGGKRPHIMYTVTMGQNPTSGLLSVRRRKEIYDVCRKFDVLIVEDDPYFYIQFPHAANDFVQEHRHGELLSANHFAESNLNYQTSLGVLVHGTVTNSNGSVHPTVRMKRGKSSGSDFLDSLVPSYLSLDVDGRVIRLDTFSKTIAPGCRLGWITAQPEFVERILRITETSTQQPSGFVQSLVAELLIGPDKHDVPGKSSLFSKSVDKATLGWKIDGWIRWLEGLRGNYERRMRTMCEILEEGKYVVSIRPPAQKKQPAINAAPPWRFACKKYKLDPTITCSHHRSSSQNSSALVNRTRNCQEESEQFEHLTKTQIYDFNPPMAGMFLWLHLNLDTHPLHTSFSSAQLSQAFWIFQTHKPYLVLLSPGAMFAANDEIRTAKGAGYFRICFAAVDEEEIKGICERFVKGAQDFWDIDDEETIKKLIEEDEN